MFQLTLTASSVANFLLGTLIGIGVGYAIAKRVAAKGKVPVSPDTTISPGAIPLVNLSGGSGGATQTVPSAAAYFTATADSVALQMQGLPGVPVNDTPTRFANGSANDRPPVTAEG